MTWQLSLTGLAIGLLVGMTGMGGGSLMTPMLVLFFGFKPTVAIGTDILHGAIFKSFGAVRHRQLGTVHARLTLWMLLGSAPASLVGVGLATWLKHTYGDGFEDVAQAILGAALVVCGIGFLVKAYVRSKGDDRPFLLTRHDRVIAVVIGLLGGFVVGLTSVGSGTFFALAMLAVFPLTAAKVVGTDIFHAAALLWVAGLGHLIGGNVDLHATAWLLIGSIPGVLIGSQLTVKLPERSLRMALARDAGGGRAEAARGAGRERHHPHRPRRRSRDRPGRDRASPVAPPGARAPLAPGLRRQRAADERLPAQEAGELVRLAAGAEAGHRGEERERRDERAEGEAEHGQAGRVRERRGAEDDEADGVREARRPRVLERALAVPRLQHLEPEQAGQAVAAPEAEPDRELEREEREQPPPAGGEREEGDEADDGLVRARAAGVDHVEVAVRVGDA